MIIKVVPKYGPKDPMVYLSICSLVGSVSVMAIKVGAGFEEQIYEQTADRSSGLHALGIGFRNRLEVDVCRE